MLKRELLRLGLCAAAGLIIGLLYAGPRAMVLFALYAIGLFYGIRFVLPALLGTLKTFGNAGIMSIVFKNPIGILILLLLCMLVVSVIITVAWVAGIVIAVMRLWRAFQEDRTMGTLFSFTFPLPDAPGPEPGAAPDLRTAGTTTDGTAEDGTSKKTAACQTDGLTGCCFAG